MAKLVSGSGFWVGDVVGNKQFKGSVVGKEVAVVKDKETEILTVKVTDKYFKVSSEDVILVSRSQPAIIVGKEDGKFSVRYNGVQQGRAREYKFISHDKNEVIKQALIWSGVFKANVLINHEVLSSH